MGFAFISGARGTDINDSADQLEHYRSCECERRSSGTGHRHFGNICCIRRFRLDRLDRRRDISPFAEEQRDRNAAMLMEIKSWKSI